MCTACKMWCCGNVGWRWGAGATRSNVRVGESVSYYSLFSRHLRRELTARNPARQRNEHFSKSCALTQISYNKKCVTMIIHVPPLSSFTLFFLLTLLPLLSLSLSPLSSSSSSSLSSLSCFQVKELESEVESERGSHHESRSRAKQLAETVNTLTSTITAREQQLHTLKEQLETSVIIILQ